MKRKVVFNEYVKREIVEGGATKEGTGKYQEDYPNEGEFLGFGSVADEGGTDTVALIEMEDGVVKTIYPDKVKFLEPDVEPYKDLEARLMSDYFVSRKEGWNNRSMEGLLTEAKDYADQILTNVGK